MLDINIMYPIYQHHRGGLNHTESNILKYFDLEDVKVTGEIVLNVVKNLTTDRCN
jgi:hypothetical protein